MHVQVIGGGSWGLAIARHLARQGHAVRLWCRDEDDPGTLRRDRISPFFLPGVRLPVEVEVSREVRSGPGLVVLAVPSHAMRKVAGSYVFSSECVRVNVAKGIENDTLLRMSQVIESAGAGGPVVTLSGPSHAEEVARDLPVSVVAAGTNQHACIAVQRAFNGPAFRVYTSPDITGVEFGGALKNVIAIAAGVCDGFELGDNAKAALITRGLAEIRRLGQVCGADPLTFSGLSGMGDLIVTCGSRHSRNRRLGERIARGETLEDILGASPMVSEGVRTTRSACDLARRAGVEMPITEAVRRVLFEKADARNEVSALLLREPKPEQ